MKIAKTYFGIAKTKTERDENDFGIAKTGFYPIKPLCI